MATRRTRIKGIANIPPRKRPDQLKKDDATENNSLELNQNEGISAIQPKDSSPLTPPLDSRKNNTNNPCSEIKDVEVKTDKILENNIDNNFTIETLSEVNKCNTEEQSKKDGSEVLNHIMTKEKADKSNNEFLNENAKIETSKETLAKPGLLRRKFLKPTVSANVISKKLKPSTRETPPNDHVDSETLEIKSSENKSENSANNNNETNSALQRNITRVTEQYPSKETEPKVAQIIRRKIIKPTVSVGVFNRKNPVVKLEQPIESSQSINHNTTLEKCLNEPKDTVNDKSIPEPNSTDFRKNQINNTLDSVDKEQTMSATVTEPINTKIVLTTGVATENNIPNNSPNVTQEKSKSTENCNNSYKEEIIQQRPLLIRRKFIKPSIALSALKTSKSVTQSIELKDDFIQNQIKDEVYKDINSLKRLSNENIFTETSNSRVIGIDSIDAREETQTTLDEVHLTSNNIISSTEGSTVRKPIMVITGTQSDIDYPPPPPSPSKINRSRIKAVPRLNYRKASFSASESEDEVRRVGNRIRNDSVCSTTSGIAESITECISTQKSREINSIIQKKCNRTEQTRKLVEARKEFQKRFGTNKPDRQQLTMMDLIFYNPESNPIVTEPSEPKAKIEKQQEIESEKVDDPAKENSEKSEEDNDIPGPQVKIGPSGEIILDEKSLVIERKELKKKQEQLQKSEIVDGDFDRGYGIYKKHKRSKKWSSNETLRFYKALNTIGTDFTLMREFFPNRTRREIKMKFKKEEKINQLLIDRALLNPCNFDYDELQNDIDTEQKENEELERQRLEKIKLKEKMKLEKPAKRKFTVVETAETNEIETVPLKPQKRRRVRKNKKTKFEDSDADESDLQTQSESEDELILQHLPTRSGRLPKVPEKFQAISTLSTSALRVTRKPAKPVPIKEKPVKKNIAEDPVPIEPGSIMIMCDNGPNGEPVYKIFMITPQQSTTPVNLAPDAIARAIQFKRGVSAENILTIAANSTDDEDDILPEENNYTIPADENVTTLRSNPVTDDERDDYKNILPIKCNTETSNDESDIPSGRIECPRNDENSDAGKNEQNFVNVHKVILNNPDGLANAKNAQTNTYASSNIVNEDSEIRTIDTNCNQEERTVEEDTPMNLKKESTCR